jgi:tellurite resistance protein TerC
MVMDHPLWMWVIFFGFVAAILVFDLGLLHRKQHEIKVKEALLRSGFYFLLAMGFNAFIFLNLGRQPGYEFFMGYLIEQSLSMDNLFVFMLIFTHFAVPREYQHRVLLWGILGALLMRGIMIGLGTTLIREFAWVTYIFGAFLIVTGIKLLFAADAEPDMENNRITNFVQRYLRVTPTYEGDRFFIRKKGKIWFTRLFLVLVLIEISDLIFAVDSIPAIFAVTHDPFIVYTSNIFAILGLRSLYFALAAFLYRFEYLKYGLSAVLVLIGAKMLVNHYFNTPVIATEFSLVAVVAILACAAGLSLLKTRPNRKEVIRTGWVPGSDSKPKDPSEE